MNLLPFPAASFSTKNVGLDVRRSVTYHPSVWGDYFLAHSSDFTDISVDDKEKHQALKEEVRKLFLATPDKSLQKLDLIDKIQRLGVGYNFESEIRRSLQYIYDTYRSCDEKEDRDLHTVALRFRLLRQQGYHVSCDLFNKFKDQEGKFDESLASDVRSMLSLYEAAHIAVHGEEILDEALEFCTTHLKSMVAHLSKSLAAQVSEALEMPIHKCLTRVGAKKFISVYQEDESHNVLLLNFSKLDFNILQKIHQQELCEVTSWWKTLDLAKNFPFARDRLVELYMWACAIGFEPQYYLARKLCTKVMGMTSILDDIYDVYGTLKEVKLLTEAIEKWDYNALYELPPYLGNCYKALLDIYHDTQVDLENPGNSYRVQYVIDEMKKVVKAYFQEAKWMHDSCIPSLEVYMKVALVSTGYSMVTTSFLVGMGELVNRETFDWVTSEPLIIRGACTLSRLMDDIVGYGFETKVTAVDCFMNQNGTSKEKAIGELQKQVSKAWKDINQEWLQSKDMPVEVLIPVANLVRVMYLLYTGDDNYTNSKTKTKDIVTTLFIQPVGM